MDAVEQRKTLESVFAHELLKNKSSFHVFPKEAGMFVDEFIKENRKRLRELTQRIRKEYRIMITKEDLPTLRSAIRFFLKQQEVMEPIPGMGVDWSKRGEVIEEFKKYDRGYILERNGRA